MVDIFMWLEIIVKHTVMYIYIHTLQMQLVSVYLGHFIYIVEVTAWSTKALLKYTISFRNALV